MVNFGNPKQFIAHEKDLSTWAFISKFFSNLDVSKPGNIVHHVGRSIDFLEDCDLMCRR
jgi:hypothetical protein